MSCFGFEGFQRFENMSSTKKLKLAGTMIIISLTIALLALQSGWIGTFYAFVWIPFVVIVISVTKASLVNALVLIVVWGTYLSVLSHPFSYVLGKSSVIVGLYSPLMIIYAVTRKKPSKAALQLQAMIWDTPLVVWMQIVSMFGGRALEVRYA